MKHIASGFKKYQQQGLLGLCAIAIAGLMVFAAPGVAHAVVDPGKGASDGGSAPECVLPDGSGGVKVQYPNNDNSTCCPAGSTDPVSCMYDKYINPTINLLAALVGILVVISIIWGALEYVMSGGDPQKAAAGRKRITTALVALAAFILLYGFMQFIVPGGFLNG